MKIYRYSIFVSAFLLFMVQPVMTKYFLPWFGGSVSVWATSLMFFTSALLIGYLYAHLLIRLPKRNQIMIHGSLLFLSVVLLFLFWNAWGSPLSPSLDWRPDPQANPTGSLLWLLGIVVALPYVLLSATSPLLQSWFFRTQQKTAYSLYAVSNLGSLGALLSYPFFFEPLFPIQTQGWIWGSGFLLFVALMAFVFRQVWKSAFSDLIVLPQQKEQRKQVVLWMVLAMIPAFLLVATTNAIAQGIASIPLLWVMLLAIYLLTFILAFSGRTFSRVYLSGSLVFISLVSLDVLSKGAEMGLVSLVVVLSTLLFLSGLFFHDWLYRLRPEGFDLTRYYLWISFGGALGTAICTFLFPLLFNRPIELTLGICLVVYISTKQFLVALKLGSLFSARRKRMIQVVVIFIIGLVALSLIEVSRVTFLFQDRSFYSILQVYEKDDGFGILRKLGHGRIHHGSQFVDGPKRFAPISYFGKASGIGLILNRESENNQRVGVVGLGIGTLAAYCDSGDVYRFFEIDPLVETVARTWFSYLDYCEGSQVVLGDGRLSLEQEDIAGDELYDVLIIDAFTDDAIPLHLLTQEAVELYFHRLKPTGILAFQISNRFVDLKPVLRASLVEHGRFGRYVENIGETSEGTTTSKWILLANDDSLLPAVNEFVEDFSSGRTVIWTDAYSNLLSVIRQ